MEDTSTETPEVAQKEAAAKPAAKPEKLEKEIATLKEKLAKSTEANKRIAEEKKSANVALKDSKAEVESLKKEIELLKLGAVVPEVESTNDHITLPNGKVVKVLFGVNIPELGSTMSKNDLLENHEAVSYLLEIGSGAVSIVEAETEKED